MDNNLPLEIEKKFLIEYPDMSLLEAMHGFNLTEISQTYIKQSENGAYGRIRKRGLNGNYTYTKTFKRDITDTTRVEIEGEISVSEYEKLLKDAREGFKTINKKRIVIEYNGLKFEIDIYPFWSNQAVMEVELPSEDTKFTTPPCVKVIKDVTSDKSYRNSSIAQML